MSKYFIFLILGLASVVAMERRGRNDQQREFFQHMQSFLQQHRPQRANPSTSLQENSINSNPSSSHTHSSTSNIHGPSTSHPSSSDSNQSQSSTLHPANSPSQPSIRGTNNYSSSHTSYSSRTNTSRNSTLSPSAANSSRHSSSNPPNTSTLHPSTSSTSNPRSTSRSSTAATGNHSHPGPTARTQSRPSTSHSSISHLSMSSTFNPSHSGPSTSTSSPPHSTSATSTSHPSRQTTSRPPASSSSTSNPSRPSTSHRSMSGRSRSSASNPPTSTLSISNTGNPIREGPFTSIQSLPSRSLPSTSQSSMSSPHDPSTSLQSPLNRNLQSCMDALHAASSSIDNDDYTEEMNRLFQPAKRLRKAGPARRGPKVMVTKFQLCCLQNADTSQSLPRGNAMTALTEAGLGQRTADNVRLNLSEAEFRELLYSIFTALRRLNFTICTTNRGRTLTPIPSDVEYSPSSLRSHLGRRFRGQLFIVPTTSIESTHVVPTNIAQVAPVDPSEATDVTHNSTSRDQSAEYETAPTFPSTVSSQEVQQPEEQVTGVPLDSSSREEVSLSGRGHHALPIEPAAELNDTLPDMTNHSNPTRLMGYERTRALRNLQGIQEITVRRANIYSDVIHAYQRRGIVQSSLRVRFAGEAGEDLSGLTREMLTLFWDYIFQHFFTGSDDRYPVLTVSTDCPSASDWVTIGRVLFHGYVLTGWLPPTFSPVSLYTAITGNIYPDTMPITNYFLQTLSPNDREAFLVAQRNTTSPYFPEPIATQIMCTLSNLQCSRIPHPRNFQTFLSLLSRNILIERPYFALLNIHAGVAEGSETVWRSFTVTGLQSLLQTMAVTTDSFLSNLRPEFSTDNPLHTALEETVYSFLKDYIRNCDCRMLALLLQFATASRAILGPLTVTFDGNQEENSFIHVSTCGTQLVLSRFIPSFPVFKQIMDSILNNRDLWSFFDTI